MYKVFFNDLPLHDLRSDELLLREPDVHLAVGEAGEFSFNIDPGHPYAAELTRMKGVVRLLSGPVQIFRGRIRKDARDFGLSRRIEVEGLLACLNDSIIPPHSFPEDFLNDAAYKAAAANGNVVKFYLEWLLGQHNSQVGDDQKVQLGDVTVTDPNNYISRASSDYLTTMEAVKKKLENLMGGYLVADYSGDTTVLHYYEDLPLTNIQEVEFATNLLDLDVELDATETYTAILPVGKDGLTIESMSDGTISPGIVKKGLIVYSEEAEADAGGRITRKVDWEDVTEPANLQRKAVERLQLEGVKHVLSITCKAADLGGTDELPRFMVGRYVRLTSPPHGFATAYPLMELEPNLLDPADTTITLGATVKAASDIAHGNLREMEEEQDRQKIEFDKKKGELEKQQGELEKQQGELEKQQGELEKQQGELEKQQGELQGELDKQKGDIAGMVEIVRTQATEIIQTCESIIFSAVMNYAKTSDLESLRQTIASEFSIMAEQISMKFTQVSEHIVNVDGDLQNTVETLVKYFDFSIDGLSIRSGMNAMSLKLDNDIISFEKNGVQFGWWDGVDFHTGNIVIDVTERAQLGNFAYVPRSNGSLDFLKVGG